MFVRCMVVAMVEYFGNYCLPYSYRDGIVLLNDEHYHDADVRLKYSVQHMC